MRMTRLAALALSLLLAAPAAMAQRTAADFFPEQLDPFTGEYLGQWDTGEDVDVLLAAQIHALGRDRYRIVMKSKLDMRSTPKFVAEARANGNVLDFSEDRETAHVENGVITGGRGKLSSFTLKKVTRENPALGTPAPEGAQVLFDGTNLDAWQPPKGWEITPEGTLMVTPEGDYLITREKYGDVQLHVEFRLPYMPAQGGQARGNSGVFLNDEYEVQVLDSFGLEGYYDDCGAIYKVAAPKVNACRPPLEWQAYDITFHAAKYDEAGKLIANPRMTVLHNGVYIHKDEELPWITGWKHEDRQKPHPAGPGYIKLQGHNNYVQFRNIWVKPL
jgi:hypothetical protein